MKNFIIAVLVLAVGVMGYFLLSPDNNNSSTQTQNQAGQPSQSTSGGQEVMDLSKSGLESLSSNAFDGKTNVTKLDVSGNNLTGALPAEIRKLSSLEVLDASDNQMTGIPAEIGQLSRLKTADFSNNDISGLPLEIGNLSNLETLDLRGNPNVSQYDISQIKAKIPNAKILTDN